MAQTNYTPIILYNSGTTTNAPSASNLASGELAINYTDGKLFYKDNSSAIQVIGWKTTPTTAGGTGLTSYTAGDLPYYASGSTLSKLGIGTSGYVLQSNGSAPTWVAQSTLSVGTATNATNTAITDNTSSSATWYPTIVSATTGNLPQTTSSTKLSFVPSTGALTSTSLTPTNPLAVAYGGTNASSASITAFNNITGYTASGATGTTSTNLVFSASPTFTGNASFATLQTSGKLSIGASATAGVFHYIVGSNSTDIIGYIANSFSTLLYTGIGNVTYSGGENSADAVWYARKSPTTGRSINAAGTVNAAGLDYAEYMVKSGNFSINKGDICGIDVNGKLTNVFANSISFVVKSTNPSYVGGDIWASESIVGVRPTDSTELSAWQEKIESARALVDRIAFSGQVPINVTGASVGQYIVPIANSDGSIGGQAISESSITLQQYMQSVGKVISVVNNVTTIIVKVS